MPEFEFETVASSPSPQFIFGSWSDLRFADLKCPNAHMCYSVGASHGRE
jgi:hypothetical protein